ncbi:TonB-dependent receptor domain-containing protein [Paraglaciecola aestuariivivens]
MFNNTKLAKSIRLAMLFGATALVTPYSMSQEAEAETEVGAEAEAMEKIEITGSRIKKLDLETTRPVTFVDSDYIAERGITNAQSAVTDIPGVFAAASPTVGGNTGAASQGVGQRTINIFGLGSQRTLTLVNGNRFVSSNSPVGGASADGNQLDVSNIPVSLIDRVEVVKVGGAATYGADAVAGVVNYVLKKDYEGAEVSVDNNFIGTDIGNDFSVRGLIGGNFDSGKGNAVVAVEYNKLDNILARDVPTLAKSWSSFTPTAADAVLDENGERFVGQVRLYEDSRAGILSFSGLITPGGLAITNLGIGAWSDGNFYQVDPSGSGNLVPYDTGVPTGNVVWSSGGDGLDLGATNTATEGYERFNMTSMSTYALTDNINLNFLAFANHQEAKNPGYQSAQYNSGVFGGLSGALRFDTSYPYLNDQARTQLEGLMGGQGAFYMHKGWVDLGQREVINESNVFSYKFGLDGEFEMMDEFWTWELNYQKGWSSVYSQSSQVNGLRLLTAMDVGVNPDTGEIDCRYNYEAGYGEQYRSTGFGLTADDNPLGAECAPLNPFGPISDAAKDYVLYNSMGKTRIEQEVFNGYLSGTLMSLPAGDLGMAVGFEHRKEFASFADDAVGSFTGTSSNSLDGDYDTTDAYVELYAPVVSPDMDIPFVDSLSVETSFRTMDNSRSGADTAWALGVNFRPLEDVMVRGNVQRTVRAPAVSELFLPVVDSSQFATDPCDARNRESGPNPEVRQRNCDAEGIPADFASIAQNASRRGFTGGNSELGNEEAKSKNLGIIYSPSWFEGFQVAADYVEIDINNAIVSFSLTSIMEACYDGTDYPNKFCDSFTRLPNGQLPTNNAFTSGFVNAALRSFRAIEYTASYSTEVKDIPFVGDMFGEAGSFDMAVRAYNLKKNATSNTGFDFTDTTGQHNNPDWRSDIRLRHSIGDLTTLVDIEYHGEGVRNVNQANDLQYIDQFGNPYKTIEARTLVHLSMNYSLTETTNVRARVTNLLDWEPSAKENSVGRWTYGQSINVGFTTKF